MTDTIAQAVSSGTASNSTACDVSPEIAETWLGRMPRNRGLSADSVVRYAADMKAGRWQYTGEAIKFDTNGNLVDGQHRLRAVVESGVTVRMLVVFDLSLEAQDVMDTGRKRRPSDVLTLHGNANPLILAAAARIGVSYERGELRTATQALTSRTTTAEILDYVDTHPGLSDACTYINSGRALGFPMRPSVGSFALTTLRDIDREQADAYFLDLSHLRTTGEGDPRFALLRRLTQAKQTRERLSPVTECHFLFRAWNAIRANETLSLLKTGTMSTPYPFAMPR